ncbi:hypothetical protein [Rhizohabitans arisaemae]|uniref:hypothetical protein n=1 Tax=Rhizohabitans arisaemae TaxID=2720610 RepID=UPI0024B1723C|nr:hypothetical protein [Rhizohabitans arisaemae]
MTIATLAAVLVVPGTVVLGNLLSARGAPDSAAHAPPVGVTSRMLTEFVRPQDPRVLPRLLEDGSSFRAIALNGVGDVLGTTRKSDRSGVVGGPQGVWLASWENSAVLRKIKGGAEDPSLWTMAAGDRISVWSEGVGLEGRRLECVEDGSTSPSRTLDDRWESRERFFADRDVVVWTRNDKRRLAMARSCSGTQRTLPAQGQLKALSYPYAYLRQGTKLTRIHLESGKVSPLPAQPSARDAARGFVMAAGDDVVAWAAGSTLTVLHLRTQANRWTPLMPQATDDLYIGSLTVGDRLLVYTATHSHRDEAVSLVYDLRTGRQITVPDEVMAAGDRLLWRDGDTYRLARVPG